MAINENEKVARAEKLLKEALSDPETRRILQIKERARIDRRLDLSQAFKEGKEEGKAKGKKEGRKEGIQKIAKKMLEEKFTKEKIMKITGLTEEEIEKLQ